jgi:hypothetical protein
MHHILGAIIFCALEYYAQKGPKGGHYIFLLPWTCMCLVLFVFVLCFWSLLMGIRWTLVWFMLPTKHRGMLYILTR